MAHKATHRQTSSSSTLAPVVLFGVDDHGKPKAARFIEKDAELATKAAGQLKLQVLHITGPAVADLAGCLPTGRIHANGRGFVPYVRRDLYAKLVAAAGMTAQTGQPSSAATTRDLAKAGSHQNGEGTLPKTWGEIGGGHVVIALDEPGEGWYEAIVVETVATCSRCDGATTRASDGSAVIGSASGCCTPTACQQPTLTPILPGRRPLSRSIQKHNLRRRPEPFFPRLGTTSTSTVSYSRKKTGRGAAGGKRLSSPRATRRSCCAGETSRKCRTSAGLAGPSACCTRTAAELGLLRVDPRDFAI